MDLPQLRSRARRDLKDEDPASYRWTDAELDRHIEHALREFSLAVPREAQTVLTTSGTRDLSLTTLSDRVVLEAVEYPRGQYPPSYVPFSLWGDTLTLLIDKVPGSGEEVVVYYGRLHTLDATTSTIPPHLEEVVVMGAEGFAALEWASYAINRVNTGGGAVWREYLSFGQEKLGAFMENLARHGKKGAVCPRRLYRPAEPRPSQATDWGP